MVRQVRLYGDPVLREKTRHVEEITDEIKKLVVDLHDTCVAYKGFGLSAQQVGSPWKVCVIRIPKPEQVLTLINPTLVASGCTEAAFEGCLSFPGVSLKIRRRWWAKLEALDGDGKAIRLDAEKLLARVLQHEVDHLDGVLFIDRADPRHLSRCNLTFGWEAARTVEPSSAAPVEA